MTKSLPVLCNNLNLSLFIWLCRLMFGGLFLTGLKQRNCTRTSFQTSNPWAGDPVLWICVTVCLHESERPLAPPLCTWTWTTSTCGHLYPQGPHPTLRSLHQQAWREALIRFLRSDSCILCGHHCYTDIFRQSRLRGRENSWIFFYLFVSVYLFFFFCFPKPRTVKLV